MSIATNASKKKIFDGRKMWFLFAGIAAVIVAVLSFAIMKGVTATDTYYVLTKDVPARTAITVDLLEEVTTSAGKTPPTALDISDITEDTYSLYSLKAGDILTTSNTGDLLSLSEGLPADFVITSFVANPSFAAGGNVKRGDYVDIMMLSDDASVTGVEGMAASYILQRVLVIDATVDLDSYSAPADEESTASVNEDGSISENTADSSLRSGIPTLFTVGLSQENASRLAVASQYTLFVVLSSADSSNDNSVNPATGSSNAPGIWGSAPNAGDGTDNTFGQGGKKVDKPGTTTPTNTQEPSAPSAPSTPTPENTEGTGGEGTEGTDGTTDEGASEG